MSSLFTPLRLAGQELPNRLVRSATWEGLADDEGLVQPPLVELYANLARGGVGLVITGYAYVRPEGKGLPRQLGIWSDDHLPGLRQLVEVIHRENRPVIAQLVHAGGQTNSGVTGQAEVLAPSALHYATHDVTPRELTTAEVEELIQAHLAGADRAIRAGLDGVQLHAAHGYLANRFLSPAFNLRSDRYGGDARARAQFVLDIARLVRDRLGPDKILSVKLNSEDFEEGGLVLADSLVAARLLADAGVDHLEISGGTPLAGKLGAVRAHIDRPEQEAYFRTQAAAFKAALPSLPIGVVGGIRSLAVAEELMAVERLDTVSLARPLICEPELPSRWLAGDGGTAKCRSDSRCFSAGIKGGIRCPTFS